MIKSGERDKGKRSAWRKKRLLPLPPSEELDLPAGFGAPVAKLLREKPAELAATLASALKNVLPQQLSMPHARQAAGDLALAYANDAFAGAEAPQRLADLQTPVGWTMFGLAFLHEHYRMIVRSCFRSWERMACCLPSTSGLISKPGLQRKYEDSKFGRILEVYYGCQSRFAAKNPKWALTLLHWDVTWAAAAPACLLQLQNMQRLGQGHRGEHRDASNRTLRHVFGNAPLGPKKFGESIDWQDMDLTWTLTLGPFEVAAHAVLNAKPLEDGELTELLRARLPEKYAKSSFETLDAKMPGERMATASDAERFAETPLGRHILRWLAPVASVQGGDV